MDTDRLRWSLTTRGGFDCRASEGCARRRPVELHVSIRGWSRNGTTTVFVTNYSHSHDKDLENIRTVCEFSRHPYYAAQRQSSATLAAEMCQKRDMKANNMHAKNARLSECI